MRGWRGWESRRCSFWPAARIGRAFSGAAHAGSPASAREQAGAGFFFGFAVVMAALCAGDRAL
ncbi:MAG: hypothetical protein ACRCV9_14490, partial [Burkholderiaceae bacterium]